MAIIAVLSPGKDENEMKNQDRAKVFDEERVAVVCDGTSTSPYCQEAAQFVSESTLTIFDDEKKGFSLITNELIKRRQASLQQPVSLLPEQENLRHIFEEVVKSKRQMSYQTTLIAARWNHNREQENLNLEWVGCGDSALFVFNFGGDLLKNSLSLQHAKDSFKHLSPFTDVLPDSYNEKKHVVEYKSFPYWDTEFILCSDGFYDNFETFHEIYQWLREAQNWFFNEEKEQIKNIFERLHRQLASTKGDDDISFIWYFPRRSDIEPNYYRYYDLSQERNY